MNEGLQKFLAVGLAVLLMSVFILAIPVPLFQSLSNQKADIANLESTLDRYQAVLARSEQLKEVADQNPSDLTPFILDGTTTSLGIAEIQGLFSGYLKEINVAGGNFRPLPERREGGAKKVGFRVNFQATSYAFYQLLEKAEGSRPLMLLENISAKAPRNQDPGVDPIINFQMDVYGLQELSNGS